MSFNDSFSFCQIPDLDLHNVLLPSPQPLAAHDNPPCCRFLPVEILWKMFSLPLSPKRLLTGLI